MPNLWFERPWLSKEEDPRRCFRDVLPDKSRRAAKFAVTVSWGKEECRCPLPSSRDGGASNTGSSEERCYRMSRLYSSPSKDFFNTLSQKPTKGRVSITGGATRLTKDKGEDRAREHGPKNRSGKTKQNAVIQSDHIVNI